MPRKTSSLTSYTFTFEDDVEPKTVFHMKPMVRMETFQIANLLQSLNISEDNPNSVEALGGENSKVQEEVIYGYLRTHCTKIENWEIDGELKSGKVEYFIDMINAVDALTIVSDALSRTVLTEEEAKN